MTFNLKHAFMFFQIIHIFHIFFITFTIGWAIQQLLERFDMDPSVSHPSLDWLCVWGFGGLVVILQIAHLFVPINGIFQSILSIICLIILLFSYKFMLNTYPFCKFNQSFNFKYWFTLIQPSKFNRLFKFDNFFIYKSLFIIILSVFALMESVRETQIFDTFLYHHGAIRWINDYPIVKGLANLHNRYGFNSTMFLTSAFFNGRWLNSNNLLPTVNIFFFLLMILRGSYESQKAYQSGDFFKAFFHISFVFIVFFQLKAFFSTVSPDLISTVLLYYLFLAFANMTDTAQQKLNFIHIVFLVFLLPTLKLSQSTCALALLFLGFHYRWYLEKKAWILTILTGSVFILPWLGRTILLTGYPLFPSTAFDFFPVDWKVPATSASDVTFISHSAFSAKALIQSWARIPGEHFSKTLTMPYSEWVPIWFKDKSAFTQVLIALAAASPLSISCLFLIKKIDKLTFLLWLSAFVNVVFWFFSAPDFRFAVASIVLCSLFTLRPFFIFFSQTVAKRLVLTTIFAFFIYIFYVELVKKNTRITPSGLSETLIRPAKYPVPMLLKKSANGFNYYISEPNSNCGDCPLPCSPYENPRLILRGPDVSQGFRVSDF